MTVWWGDVILLVYALLVSGTNLRLGGGGEMRDRIKGDVYLVYTLLVCGTYSPQARRGWGDEGPDGGGRLRLLRGRRRRLSVRPALRLYHASYLKRALI